MQSLHLCRLCSGRDDMKLWSISINGSKLSSGDYKLTPKTLTIQKPPSGNFDVEIQTRIKPQENTSLEGLYKSGGNYCTQCEAEVGSHFQVIQTVGSTCISPISD